MKIVCKKSELLKSLNLSLRAVASKMVLPILKSCLIIAKDNYIEFISYNMEIAIKTKKIDADIIEDGAIVIDARVLFDIVKSMPSDEIELDLMPNNIINIKSNKSEFKIIGSDISEFPNIPDIEIIKKEEMYKLPSNQLKNMIKQSIFSVSKNDTKPQLCGGLFEFTKESFRIVTIDGFRISYRNFPFIADDKNKAIIPEKTMSELLKILPQEEDSFVDIYISNKHILFDTKDCIIVSSLLEGEFINYEAMFETKPTTKLKFKKDDLVSPIERSMVLSQEIKKNPIKLKIEENKIKLSSNSDFGSLYEELDIEQDGDDLEISFNPRYILDALKSIESEFITMDLTLSLQPCVIKAYESTEYSYLVLPLRVR